MPQLLPEHVAALPGTLGGAATAMLIDRGQAQAGSATGPPSQIITEAERDGFRVAASLGDFVLLLRPAAAPACEELKG